MGLSNCVQAVGHRDGQEFFGSMVNYRASILDITLQEAARGSRLQITHVMLKRASFLTEMTEGTQPPKLPQNGTDLISLQIDCHL
jgi:hypothetical protein